MKTASTDAILILISLLFLKTGSVYFILQDPKQRRDWANEKVQPHTALHVLSLDKVRISKANSYSVIYFGLAGRNKLHPCQSHFTSYFYFFSQASMSHVFQLHWISKREKAVTGIPCTQDTGCSPPGLHSTWPLSLNSADSPPELWDFNRRKVSWKGVPDRNDFKYFMSYC